MRYLLLLIISLLFSTSIIKAQTIIVKSENVVQDIRGNNFYLHIVKKGETLYAIAKAYGVAVEEITANNSDTEKGLKEDMELKIPVPKNKEDKPFTPEGFLHHKVKKGETLYGIMKKYDINNAQLVKYNPNISSNIHPGQYILIPTKEKIISEKAVAKYDSLIDYTIQKKDTYYKLEKKYNVKQSELEKLNIGLKESGLQKGLTIKIPATTIQQESLINIDKIEDKAKEIISKISDSLFISNLKCKPIKNNTEVYKIGIMIPLFSELEKDINVEHSYLIKSIEEYKSLRFIEFYQGALMAIDSLKKTGLNAEFYIWDTHAKKSSVDSICSLDEFKNLDLLIGPFYSNNVEIAEKECARNGITFVNIFDNTTLQNNNTNELYILKSDDKAMYNSLTSYIKYKLINYRISIIHYGRSKEIIELETLKKALLDNNIDSNLISIYNYAEDGMNKLITELNSEKNNIIFNLVDNEARISNFLRQLNIKKDDYNITVMSLEKSWVKYKTIEIEYLNNLSYTYATDYYINYSDSLPYINNFYNTNKRIPGKLGILGFDAVWFFGKALHTYGSNFNNCINDINVDMIHNKVNFEVVNNKIYRNNHSQIIKIDKYKKSIVN